MADVRGPISIVLFHYPFCLKDGSEQWHRGKLVIKLKYQNSIRTLTLPANSRHTNPIQNLWRKVTLETFDNQTKFDRLSHGRLEPKSHPRPLRQAVLSIQTPCRKSTMSIGGPKIYHGQGRNIDR